MLCIINIQIINYEQSTDSEQGTWSYKHWKNKSQLVLYEDYLSLYGLKAREDWDKGMTVLTLASLFQYQ